MKPYEQYKHSGIDWLGQVPSHWEVLSLKRVARINPGVYVKDKYSDEKVCFLPMEKVLANGQVIDDLFLPIKDISSGFTIFAKNDVIVAKITPCFENGKSAFLDKLPTEFGYGSTEFHVLRPSKKILGKFLYSIIHSKLFLDNGEAMMIGSAGQKRVPTDFVANFKIALPPLPEQTAIAKFLDEKTTQIQMAIGIKNKQIAKLKEYCQALINQTVTKGLNANTPMKNSGVEWLGEVPSHWEIGIGMMILKENKRSNKGMKENTILSLSYGEIIVKDESKLFGLVPESFETYQIVEPNDIIIRCTDLQNDKTSLRTGLAKNKGIITSAYLNLGVKQGYYAKFIHYYLHTLDITKVIYGLGSGLRQNLSFLDFRRLPFPIPPLPEQLAIAEFLDKKTAQIDKAIAHHQNQIKRLKEYQQSLVNDVVTGKMRVSNLENNIGVN